MDASVFLILIVIIVIGVLVFIAISKAQQRGGNFDKAEYQGRWLAIENSLRRDNPDTYSGAVMEADKLLDHALKEMGARGKTMGERLKSSGSRFSNVNQVWTAHKIRNKLAHEMDYKISYKQAAGAVHAFRQALKDLGAV